jgi:hypothetical protein
MLFLGGTAAPPSGRPWLSIGLLRSLPLPLQPPRQNPAYLLDGAGASDFEEGGEAGGPADEGFEGVKGLDRSWLVAAEPGKPAGEAALQEEKLKSPAKTS